MAGFEETRRHQYRLFVCICHIFSWSISAQQLAFVVRIPRWNRQEGRRAIDQRAMATAQYGGGTGRPRSGGAAGDEEKKWPGRGRKGPSDGGHLFKIISSSLGEWPESAKNLPRICQGSAKDQMQANAQFNGGFPDTWIGGCPLAGEHHHSTFFKQRYSRLNNESSFGPSLDWVPVQ